MRANADKRRQTQANAEAKTQANASKREQTCTNANKRLHPPLLRFFTPPFAIPLTELVQALQSRHKVQEQKTAQRVSFGAEAFAPGRPRGYPGRSDFRGKNFGQVLVLLEKIANALKCILKSEECHFRPPGKWAQKPIKMSKKSLLGN